MAEAALAWDRERLAKPLFLVTVVVGSFLLFLTQPMVARMALPRIGGAPAVWNSAMLVYQALLLGGYGYAHLLGKGKPRVQAWLHVAMFAIAALWLPIGLRPDALPTTAEPAIWVPWFLVSSIGPLFFMISTQAPLMQRWYALETSRGDPYPLYAASNVGSFAGLISYPLIVEPLLPLAQQSALWTVGYAILVLLVACCALTMPATAVAQDPAEAVERPSWRALGHWTLLATVPSGLMLSTTTHLTTDIVAIPLLWVLPLGLYLLSFVVAFRARTRPTQIITLLVPLLMLITGVVTFSKTAENPLYQATFALLLLFGIAVALHGEMYRLRPPPQQLTWFYLAMAVGGMVGGIFCAIIAPLIFDWIWEHPLLLILAAMLIPQRPLLNLVGRVWRGPAGRWLVFVVPVFVLGLSWLVGSYVGPIAGTLGIAGGLLIILFALLSIGKPLVMASCLAAVMLCYGGWNSLYDSFLYHTRIRSYFGVYAISYHADGRLRLLSHGTTMHGAQDLTPGRQHFPTTYYHPRSGAGLVMREAPYFYGRNVRVGVVGLGTGTLACYALPGQDWQFFEIDPTVIGIARDKFSFLQDCAPQALIRPGDARITLAHQVPGSFDVLALDAFSSDTVPMHLLTHEAFAIYARVLQPNGTLLVHISNRYLDLLPVVLAAARKGGWTAAALDFVPTSGEDAQFSTRSIWIAMSRNPNTITALKLASMGQGEWMSMRPKKPFPGWSDDYATILPLIKKSELIPSFK